MLPSAFEITNLLYRYAELIDAGDLRGAGKLFANAKVRLVGSDELQDGTAAAAMLKRFVKIYDCGTPRTRHVVTNPVVEIDEAAGTAACRSYYTVLQAAEKIPLQIVASGRYHDRFARTGGAWHFSFRDFTLFDMAGDVSGHLNMLA